MQSQDTPSQATLIQLVETMFRVDAGGRLTGDAPHLHIVRTPDFTICRRHADLPEATARALDNLTARPRGRPSEWAREWADYLRQLSAFAPLKSLRAGPLYAFPETLAPDEACVGIDQANAGLLQGGLDDWTPDVAKGLPMAAVVIEGRAVALCASVRASAAVQCAGVETLLDYRGRGLAARATAAWAGRVRAAGATPFYATTFDNIASQGVAWRLGLPLIGAEFSVECERT